MFLSFNASCCHSQATAGEPSACRPEWAEKWCYRTRVFRCDGPVWRRFRGQLPFGAVNDALTSAGNSVYVSYTLFMANSRSGLLAKVSGRAVVVE